MFSALRHRNLRLYLGGQFVSLIGTWMQQLAMSWLVYRMTHSPYLLGLVTFVGQVPSFIFGLFAGVLVDRVNLHKLLIGTQALSSIQAWVLAGLTLSGKITLPEILILSAFLGIINAIDTPTRQSFVIQMIGDDKKDLPNAIALNSSVMNATRLFGPALAGIIITMVGEGVCFLLNALSYIAVLIALTQMRVKPRLISKTTESFRESFVEGMRFAFGVHPIGILLILLTALSLVGSPFVTLMPVMADQVFKGGAHTLGFLTTSTAIGALFASVWLASRKSAAGFQSKIGICSIVFAIALITLSFSSKIAIAIPVLLICGFGMLFQMAASNIMIQTLVEDDKRGRVMSLFTFSLMGVAPFGSLLVGTIAEHAGVFSTLLFCGGTYLLVVLWVNRRLQSEILLDSSPS